MVLKKNHIQELVLIIKTKLRIKLCNLLMM